MILMVRNTPYHSKKRICKLIDEGNVFITEEARKSAKDCFGWEILDIEAALKKLPRKACYKSERRFNNPSVWVDYYRAWGLMGENVYTHFYIENNMLIIDSFKEI